MRSIIYAIVILATSLCICISFIFCESGLFQSESNSLDQDIPFPCNLMDPLSGLASVFFTVGALFSPLFLFNYSFQRDLQYWQSQFHNSLASFQLSILPNSSCPDVMKLLEILESEEKNLKISLRERKQAITHYKNEASISVESKLDQDLVPEIETDIDYTMNGNGYSLPIQVSTDSEVETTPPDVSFNFQYP